MADPRVTGRPARTNVQARRSDAREAPRESRREPRREPDPPRGPIIGWSRRIGVILAATAVGGTIVLAGSGMLDDHSPKHIPSGSPSASARATATPGTHPTTPATSGPTPAAPTIAGAATVLTRDATWTLTIDLPVPLATRRDSTVRIYRDDKQIAEADVGKNDSVRFPDVPLRRGDNHLTAAVVSPAGQGPSSAEVVVTRDDQPPAIHISAPAGGASVGSATVTVIGTTEPGATLTVTNTTTGDTAEPVVLGDGSFQAITPIALGANHIAIRAGDAAGNGATSDVDVTGIASRASVTLHVVPGRIPLDHLPATVSLDVVVVDADGNPAEGVAVVFSLSPSGLPTSTYHAVTTGGTAAWTDVNLPREGAVAGDGFATVQVTLADGTVLRKVHPFAFH